MFYQERTLFRVSQGLLRYLGGIGRFPSGATCGVLLKVSKYDWRFPAWSRKCVENAKLSAPRASPRTMPSLGEDSHRLGYRTR